MTPMQDIFMAAAEKINTLMPTELKRQIAFFAADRALGHCLAAGYTKTEIDQSLVNREHNIEERKRLAKRIIAAGKAGDHVTVDEAVELGADLGISRCDVVVELVVHKTKNDMETMMHLLGVLMIKPECAVHRDPSDPKPWELN